MTDLTDTNERRYEGNGAAATMTIAFFNYFRTRIA